MIVNYELQIQNHDEKRLNCGEYVRIIKYPVCSFEDRLKEAHAHSELSSNYTYAIYAVDERGCYTLVGEGDYDENKGGGFYFALPKEEDK